MINAYEKVGRLGESVFTRFPFPCTFVRGYTLKRYIKLAVFLFSPSDVFVSVNYSCFIT